jgi:aldehyde:ferredoxin oxidoreductase
VIGPAGENWEQVWYACIVGTTQEYVMTGEDKVRFAGRLGMGSVLGSKNIVALVAYAEQDDYKRGDERLKAINREIGRGAQSKNYRHPNNYDGGGGTGRLEMVLDRFGVLPYKNFEPRGENLSVSTHLETVRDAPQYIVIDKNCFGCRIACHQDVYASPEGGKDPDLRKARRNHGPFLGRYEYEPMELTGPNLGIDDVDENLRLARLTDELGLDAISSSVVVSFLMDYNDRYEDKVAGGIRFGDAAGVARVMEDIAYGREPLFGKGVKKISEEIGGHSFAMHCKGVEHSAYLGQTNPGYPFATAGGHMSMRTYLAYMIDPDCRPESADYWVDQITNEGWKMINFNLHGGCLFTLAPAEQTAEAISSIYGIDMSAEALTEATHRTHLLGFALEQKQGATVEDYELPEEVFVGNRKGDLPGVHFLTRELFEEIRTRVLDKFKEDAARFGYL